MDRKRLLYWKTLLLATAAAAGGIVAVLWKIKRTRTKKSVLELRQLHNQSQLSNLKKSLDSFSKSFLSCSLHQMPTINSLFEDLSAKWLSILHTNISTSHPPPSSLLTSCSTKNMLSYYSCVDCSAAWNNSSHFSQQLLLAKNAQTPLNRICEDCFDSHLHEGHCVQKHISISQETCDCGRTSVLSKEFICSKHQASSDHDDQQNDSQVSQKDFDSQLIEENNTVLTSFFEEMLRLCIVSKIKKNEENDRYTEELNKRSSLLTAVLDKILEVLHMDVESYAPIFDGLLTSLVYPKKDQTMKAKKVSSLPDSFLKLIIKQSQYLGNESELKLREIFQLIGDRSPAFAETVFILTTSMREKCLLRKVDGIVFGVAAEYFCESALVGSCRDSLWRDSHNCAKNTKDKKTHASAAYLLEPLHWVKKDLNINKALNLSQEIKTYERQLRIAQQIALFSPLDSIDDQMVATFQVMQSIDEISRFEIYTEKDIDYFFEDNKQQLLIVQLLDLCDSYLTTNLAILIKRQKAIPIILEKAQEESIARQENDIILRRKNKNQAALNGIYKLEKEYRNHVKQLSTKLHILGEQYATVSLSSAAELALPYLLMLSSFECTKNSLRSLFSQPKSKEIILNIEFILRSYMPSARQTEFQTLILQSMEQSQASPLHGILQQFHSSFLEPKNRSVLLLSRYHRLILTHQIASLALFPERIDSCSFFQTFIHLTNQNISPEGSIKLPSLYLSLAILIDSQPFEYFRNIYNPTNEQIEDKLEDKVKDSSILLQIKAVQEKIRRLIGQEVNTSELIEIAELLLALQASPFPCSFICEIRQNLFLSQLNSNIMRQWIDNYEQCNHPTALACFFILIYQTISYELDKEIAKQSLQINPLDLCYAVFFSPKAQLVILQAFDADFATQDQEAKIFTDLINYVQTVCDKANSLEIILNKKNKKSEIKKL